MHMATALAILVLGDLCLAIRVPVVWGDSAVQYEQQSQPSQDSVSGQQKLIPTEYFVYSAEKPQFAVDVAAFHGVKSPESHYKAYPVRPYTGIKKPELGRHKIQDHKNAVFHPFQEFTKTSEALKDQLSPASIDYEIFHPYKAEEPALQQIYRDPVLSKIRNDIRNSQQRLQNYENESGKPDITEDEYLESPEETDRKKFPHRNVPVPYEIHMPQRKPIYYRPAPIHNHREHVLNHKFKHPWNQNYARIRPVHYRPLKNHIGWLRQHHALKYDDERNEYPQVQPAQNYAEPVDGYDIYERGKDKYTQLRNNVDESINKAVKQHRPMVSQKLELQNNEDRTEKQTSDDDEEFVPVKNYAQVRKTETTKHFPREAAFNDADTFDEIRNAPRLREAIKSTKAQTVYTEEGYEDAAYDHAGEQKHAAENEGHAGFLKEKEISEGNYKAPSLTASYEDGRGNAYRDQTLHGEKWKNSDKDKEEETDSDNYSEDENEQSIEADIYEDITGERSKRENDSEDNAEVERTNNVTKIDKDTEDKSEIKQNISQQNELNLQHDVIKRETNFKVPEINLNSTFLQESEIDKISKLKAQIKKDDLKNKYPYYFRNLETIHKDSPLRYAENLKLIPKKSKGGTEFYDSRSKFECPEVDDQVDALPEKFNKDGHPDDEEDEDSENDDDEQKSTRKGQANFDHIKKNQRLKGLGDKIDCFKAKYFGENPLDSPFFKEEIISNPEPVTAPNLAAYILKARDSIITEESKLNNVFNLSDKLKENSKSEVTDLVDKLRNGQKELQESLVRTNDELKLSLLPQNTSILSKSSSQPYVYGDVLDSITTIFQIPFLKETIRVPNKSQYSDSNLTAPGNKTYNFFQNKEYVTKPPLVVRKKRATPFVYEPYKIIRDGQVQDSKKTTTTSNISPLIKQLQSSRVVDRVTKTNSDKESTAKRSVATRTYKDIGKKDRERFTEKGYEEPSVTRFVDVNVDQRRGEPRYELRPANHKLQYTPVENKKAISLEDYQAHANITDTNTFDIGTTEAKEEIKIHAQRNPTVGPYFDVTQFLPKPQEVQKSAASNKINRIIRTTTRPPETNSKRLQSQRKPQENEEKIEVEEDYEEYDDEEEESATTTSTTLKPSFRRRVTSRVTTTTTTVKPHEEEEVEPELPKLRLVTRFRHIPNDKKLEKKKEVTEIIPEKKKQVDDTVAPQYREKKKKSSKSTLVTDTKTYGDGDEEDEIRKKEVDQLIGVQHDMDEYMPHYEKEAEQKDKENQRQSSGSSEENDDEYDEDEDDEYDSEEDEDEDDDEEENEPEQITTTPEPTKRTLPRTTEAPISTTEARSARIELKPIVMRKKIEIHKELPVNKSSPHITQFKQDIKEVEIIKEMPKQLTKKKPQKNLEVLDLYKDDNLAKDINKLGGVEVFKENLDLKTGPRHGGNYRNAKLIELQEVISSTPQPLHGGNLKVSKEDAETSQSENTKHVETSEVLPARRLHGGNLKSLSDVQRSRNSGRISRLELGDEVDTSTNRRRGSNRNAKLTEFDEHEDEDDSERRMHGGNFKSYGNSRHDDRSLHGGNYRSAKIVQDVTKKEPEKKKKNDTNARSNAAKLLNSFAQAVPILTTTPAYILDPSKRMYYYVDA